MKNPLDEIFSPITNGEKPTFDKTPQNGQVQVIIDKDTGTVEWRTSYLTDGEIQQLCRLLGYKKPKSAHWNALRNALAVGSIAQVAAKNRGKKGWSESELKAFSAALPKLKM